MKNSEEAHKVTEQIYRNLNDHFTPNLRQLSLSARNYYKALVGASSAAKTYKEALEKLGHDARTNCRGTTQEIGEAIYQISEVYKEIQAQIEEQMKSLLNDLSFPLESKLETDFKNTVSSYKRYSQEHKAIAVPFEKAQVTLNKIQKKNKSRLTHSEKEVKYAQTVSRAQMRLHDHRMAGLQKAMLDEWKSYCFLLECLCSGITLVGQHSNKTHSMIEEHIDVWKQLCSPSDMLPGSSSQMFRVVATGADLLNYTDTIGNGHLRPGSTYMMPNKHYSSYSKSLPDQMQLRFTRHSEPSQSSYRMSSPMKSTSANVQAIYPHSAKSETQMSFQEGDVIMLIGEKSDGWHYGYNTNDRRYGWLPLSFTAPINSALRNIPASQPLSHKVKSLGDLLDAQDGQQWSSDSGPRRSSLADGNPSSTSKVSEHPNGPTQQNAGSMYASAASFFVPPTQLAMTSSSNIPPGPPMVSSEDNHNNIPAYSTANVAVYSTSPHVASNNFNSASTSSPTYKTRISSSPPLPPPPLNFPPPAADYADAEDISHQVKRLTTSERMNQM